MILKPPFSISARLMPGLKIGDATISLDAGPRSSDGRTQYVCFIDLPDGSEHSVSGLRSGCQGGDVQEGFASLLSFLGAAVEKLPPFFYAGLNGENSNLFPLAVVEWACENSDDIAILACEIEENERLIL